MYAMTEKERRVVNHQQPLEISRITLSIMVSLSPTEMTVTR